ncbi:cupin domain-containing protein [Blastococcus sp. SYSU D00669]
MTTPPTAADRLLAADAATEPLGPLPLDPASVLAGEPTTALRPLGALGAAEVGIWELTAGTVTDVEGDEVFVVVAGRGTVTFADGSAVALRPGAVVRLHAGDRTTWEVAEPLRKVYLA